MLSGDIKRLVNYGIESGLMDECERIYATNLLLDCFKEDEYVDEDVSGKSTELEDILSDLLAEAVKRGLCEDSVVYRDLFYTRLMNCLTPRPAEVQRVFFEKY